jgi:enoyl-CoA hydratase
VGASTIPLVATDPILVDEPVTGVLRITMHRPERLNALDRDVVGALRAALSEAEHSTETHVVVLTGAGRGFCSGWDVKGGAPGTGFRLDSPAAGMALQRETAGLIRQMRAGSVPIVAAVNGPAAGGGLSLALACDIRLAGRSASFHAGFVALGLSGGDLGTSWLLPRLVGPSHAFEILLSGRAVDADEAERIGMVSHVHPDEELMDRAIALASTIARHSPLAVGLTKEALWAGLEVPSLYAAMELENRAQVLLTLTDEHTRAVEERRGTGRS